MFSGLIYPILVPLPKPQNILEEHSAPKTRPVACFRPERAMLTLKPPVHIGIYTRLLLIFLINPLAQPQER